MLKTNAINTMLSSELWIAMVLALTNFNVFLGVVSEKGRNGQIDPVN